MTVKTSLSFTDRHRQFLSEKVSEGVFASTSAAVAAAVEQMMQDDEARALALNSMADEIRGRMTTSRDAYVSVEDGFVAARAQLRGGSSA